MKLEDQVCSLELAKKLKELGFKQDSYFYWCYSLRVSKHYLRSLHQFKNYDKSEDCMRLDYSAFTTAELGEMLPSYIDYDYQLNIIKYDYAFFISYIKDGNNIKKDIEDEKEADARAKILIHLIENGLMKI